MACYAETRTDHRRAGRRARAHRRRRPDRYLDAISSLWVTTLGHRVPELDAAIRSQLDLVAHSTMLGNGNRGHHRARRGAGVAGAGRRPTLPLRIRRRRRRRAGPEDRLPVLDEPGDRSPNQLPHARRRLPRRHHRLDLARRRRVRHRRVRPAALRGAASARLRAPGLGRCRRRSARAPSREPGRPRARAVGAGRSRHPGHRSPIGTARRRGRRSSSRSWSCSTRWPPGSVAPDRSSRPSCAPYDPTCCASARASPGATCRWRPPWRRPRLRGLPGRRSQRAHSLSRPLLQRERAGVRGRPTPSRAARRVAGARQRVATAPPRWPTCSGSTSRHEPRYATSANAG
jgi:hypothetical protein